MSATKENDSNVYYLRVVAQSQISERTFKWMIGVAIRQSCGTKSKPREDMYGPHDLYIYRFQVFL